MGRPTWGAWAGSWLDGGQACDGGGSGRGRRRSGRLRGRTATGRRAVTHLGRCLRWSVPQAVVVGAGRPAVALGGGTAGPVGQDVVDLAVLGGDVAVLREAGPVPHLHGP